MRNVEELERGGVGVGHGREAALLRERSGAKSHDEIALVVGEKPGLRAACGAACGSNWS